MEIANEFSLSVPLDAAWPLLTDLGRVAPAMPGATVTAVEPDGIRATMKVKVGPISVAYRVRVELVSQDEATHVAVLRASGREARGQGTVAATVTARLRADGEQTAVALTTDLAVTGRVAQFGGGVMKEVADRLLRQFAQRLEAQLAEEPAADAAGPAADATAPGAAPAAGAAQPAGATGAGTGAGDAAGATGAASGANAAPGAAPAAAPVEAEPVDLGRVAGAALLPSGPAVGAFGGAFLGTFLGFLLAALLLRRRP
ncbi:SRPBCC family protein [Conexibacter arvalis]|uniref:Carbon monoxide dehydrogenase subunit G n=1 Tax=Conexibacter arvalis TaxID=912552 RepID=A0A840ICK4_9ACTN|nr:SRPBCC family protein [Conexibacter arvalis]MBB4661814.1 carbon monoxide dehydrogenase subunit G [Conexibacter arvalis]